MLIDANDSSTDWSKLQDWFLNKVLQKEDRVLPRLRPLERSRSLPDYIRTRTTIPRIDYQDALFDASRSMIRFKKPRRLIKIIDKIINDKVGVTYSAVLIYERSLRSYVLLDSEGAEGCKIPAGYVRLDLKSAIVELLRKNRIETIFENSVINFTELNWILDSGQLINKDVYLHNRLRAALNEMELLNAELCVPCFFKKELLGLLLLGKKSSGRNFVREEMSLFATLANDAAMALANARLIDNLRKKVDEVEHLYEKEHNLFMNTAIALARAIDARDIYTHGHTERVTKYCSVIGEELGRRRERDIRLNRRFHELLYITALLHDIGKIGVPDRILNKKKGLSVSERRIVERHPEIGASIIYPIQELSEVAMCVRSHQEWYNGNGYPDGLKREEIPLISRIVSVADAFDAITSDRPYRKKRGAKEALDEIESYAGSQFDPQIVNVFAHGVKSGKLAVSGV